MIIPSHHHNNIDIHLSSIPKICSKGQIKNELENLNLIVYIQDATVANKRRPCVYKHQSTSFSLPESLKFELRSPSSN